MATLRFILGDQLSLSLPVLKDVQKGDLVLMAEVRDEATHVRHHRKKIAFLFSAMRHFAAELERRGLDVQYVRYDDPANSGSLTGELKRCINQKRFDQVIVTEPGEYRLSHAMMSWEEQCGLPVKVLPDTRFIASHEEFQDWAGGRKRLIMEYWYRLMRSKTGLLMEGDKPAGGQWNFDRDNRKALDGRQEFKGPLRFKPDAITLQVLGLVERSFPDHFGELEPFWFAVNGKQANQALDHFIEYQLPLFGDYQDAMQTGEAFLYHSILSQYINCGLLDPLQVCQRVEQAWQQGGVPLNAAEGFIRQIIGWREYVRGIYWMYMPEYALMNELGADRPLPGYYWDGKTDMHCVAEAVNMTRKHACSHHIQRLMVTGNFANLAGLDVRAVCDWYLAVYADAYEWVELPNTLGMALYADGGIVASKPYIASGAYINRMSDFCKDCRYDPRKRTGEDACPFTLLYWDYLIRHEQLFSGNPRMSISYRNLARFPDAEKAAIGIQAQRFLDAQ